MVKTKQENFDISKAISLEDYKLKGKKLATNPLILSIIDHTLLNQTASEKDIIKLCGEAAKYNFASVCVNPKNVKLAKSTLKKLHSKAKVCTVIGFPLGENTTDVKVFETRKAVDDGAEEIDMVISVSELKQKNYNYVKKEIKKIKRACQGRLLKVIIESALLTDEEIRRACTLSEKAGADYVKTSTGYFGGATTHAVETMKKVVKNRLGLKASGGIGTLEDMVSMVESGATRIGASKGAKIAQESFDSKLFD